MDVTSILLLLLIGALATYFFGDKLASKVALLFSLATFGFTKGIRSLKQATTELENLGEYLKLINSIKAV